MREKVFSLNSDPRQSEVADDNRETLVYNESDSSQQFAAKFTSKKNSNNHRFSDFDTRYRAKTIMDYPGLNTELKEGETAALILYRYRWIVLISFFFSSAAMGAVQGSLSTTKKII